MLWVKHEKCHTYHYMVIKSPQMIEKYLSTINYQFYTVFSFDSHHHLYLSSQEQSVLDVRTLHNSTSRLR